MPEGDTIFVLARRMNAALANKTIVKLDVRVPRYATTDLSGETISQVVSRGKHLLIRTRAGHTIHSHLKMEGRWRTTQPIGSVSAASDKVRIVIDTQDVRAIGSQLAQVAVIPSADENIYVGDLGPDPLVNWDIEEAMRRANAHLDKTISSLLLDQTIVAGFGNIYRNEICFLVGAHPARIASSLNVERIVALGAKLLQANSESARHVTTGVDRDGFRNWVYGRARRPCRRCGTTIRRANEHAERLTYWCPHCQPQTD